MMKSAVQPVVNGGVQCCVTASPGIGEMPFIRRRNLREKEI
jgi:hypothetical protein